MDDSKMPRIRRKEDLPDVMTMPLVAKTLGCSLTVAYRLLKRDDFPHMNASVNVQVNVVHSPSAVVRGDYESDLANCLNPSNSTDLDPTSQ